MIKFILLCEVRKSLNLWKMIQIKHWCWNKSVSWNFLLQRCVYFLWQKKKQNSKVGKELWEAIKSYSIEIFILIWKSSRFSAQSCDLLFINHRIWMVKCNVITACKVGVVRFSPVLPKRIGLCGQKTWQVSFQPSFKWLFKNSGFRGFGDIKK